jgi:hypothetical protein
MKFPKPQALGLGIGLFVAGVYHRGVSVSVWTKRSSTPRRALQSSFPVIKQPGIQCIWMRGEDAPLQTCNWDSNWAGHPSTGSFPQRTQDSGRL